MAHWFQDIISLVYPKHCSGCNKVLDGEEKCLCLFCKYDLPKTQFHRQLDNPVNKLFWGRIPISHGTSCFHYQKGGKVQKLIHQLKYNGKKEIGLELGALHGKELNSSNRFHDIDVVLPVPLHPEKEKLRGYNQSYYFARGIAQTMGRKCLPHLVQRTCNTQSQTKKSRYARWENMDGVFSIGSAQELFGKHFLLVDDVVTTGSTLEACAQALLQIPAARVSVSAIAYVP